MAEMRPPSLGRKNKLQVGCVASVIFWYKGSSELGFS